MELPTQTKALAQALSVAEEEGLIWVSLEPISPRPKVTFPNKEMLSLDSFFITGTAHCDIEEAAENFLDGFHTHFVHSGLVRTDQRRQVIRATVSRIDNGVEARYEGEGRQTGIVSQIFESDRAWSAGRFYYPGLAEVEYHSSKGLTLRVSAWLVPVSTGTLGLFARVSTRRGALPQWAKKAVLRPLFTRILNQDKQILELQHRNQKHFPAIRALDSKLDLLGPSIRALLAGEPIPDDAERTITVAL
jgi:phenylpropionate dioxygenase-like ring-hydroxylating dioxygenase large terminal subunit